MLLDGDEKTLVLVSIYSPPDEALLEDSYNTVWLCRYRGNKALKVIDVKTITAVVAMVPHPPSPGASGVEERRVFVVKKPGLDVAHMGGNDEDITEE